MDLKQLTYFVRVADLASYSKASDDLGIAQPHLSRQIRQLESEFGLRFFRRNGRGITLTEEGQFLLSRARSILEQLSEVRQGLESLKESPSGQVILGVVSEVSQILGVSLVTRFATLFPKASLKIVEGKSSDISEWFLSGRINIAVLNDPKPPHNADFEITPLVTRELCLASYEGNTRLLPSQKIRFHELKGLPLFLPGGPIQQVIDEVANKVGVKLVPTLDVIGRAYTLELVRRGLGYMIMTRHAAEKIKQANKLQINEIVEPSITTTIACLIPTKSTSINLIRKTAVIVQEIITENS